MFQNPPPDPGTSGDVWSFLSALAGVLLRSAITGSWRWREIIPAACVAVAFVLWIGPGIAESWEFGYRAYGSLCLFVGLIGLPVMRGIVRLAERFKADPQRAVNWLLNRRE